MLDPKQAHLIYDLASRVLTIDGEIVDVPAGFDLVEVSAAMATLEAARDDAGGRALVLEFLDRLAPDLGAAAIESDGPSKARLAKHHRAALDLLRELGGRAPSQMPRRWTVSRGNVELDLPAWIPLEVLDALARIGDALGPSTIAAAVYAGHRYARELGAPTDDDVPFRRELIDLSPA